MKQEAKGSDMIDFDEEFDQVWYIKLTLHMHDEVDFSHNKTRTISWLGAWNKICRL